MKGTPFLSRKWTMYLQAGQGTILGVFIGIVGVLMTINGYKSDIDENKVNLLIEQHALEKKLLEFKNSQIEYLNLLRQKEQDITSNATRLLSNMATSQDKIMSTIASLERHLKEERNFQIYYDDLITNISLPDPDISLELISNSSSSLKDRKQLLQFMFQDDNVYISKKASDKFLEVMSDDDVDYLIHRYVENLMSPSGFNSMIFMSKVGLRITEDNVFIYEKALIKYTSKDSSDLYVSSLVEVLYDDILQKPFILQSLEVLYSHFEKLNMSQSKSNIMKRIMELKYNKKESSK